MGLWTRKLSICTTKSSLMIRIPVKIGWELPTILLVVFAPLIYSAINDEVWLAVGISIFISIFIALVVLGIRYAMDDEFLYIKYFPFITKKIEIKNIYKIEKTWNLISSPAPSISGRVEIYWPAYNSIVISPKDFEFFKQEILKRNPNIEVKE